MPATNRSDMMQFNWKDASLLLLVIAASTVFPRMMMIGGLPATDEGYYAYQAQIIYESLKTGNGLPDSGVLALYPMLLSWVFGLGVNPIVALRLVDLVVAVCFTSILYAVLARESGSRIAAALLTQIFVFTFNQSAFIQNGFKNSITVAFVPLLIAMLIAQRARPEAGPSWFAAGALTALAVLLRETFIPFAMLGLVAVTIGFGPRAGLRFLLGGAAGGTAVLGTIIILRGGALEMIAAYRDVGSVYAVFDSRRYDFFMNNGSAAISQAWTALAVSGIALALLAVNFCLSGERQRAGRTAFWLLVAFLPIIEPAAKIAIAYHFAVSLVGLAGLSALAWREMSLSLRILRFSLATALALTAATVFIDRCFALARYWPMSREALAAMPSGLWPAVLDGTSNYLLMAAEIRKIIPETGTLSVSGFMYTLYPLTGHRPPSSQLADLSVAVIQLGLSEARLRDAILACPADVIVSTTRTDWPGVPEIKAAIIGTGLYEPLVEIPNSPAREYGHFGGTIYRKTVMGEVSAVPPSYVNDCRQPAYQASE